MTWPIRAVNGAIPVVFRQEANTVPGAHVQGGEQGEGALAPVFVLDPHRLAGRGRSGGVAAGAGLDGGLGVEMIRSPGRSGWPW
ncbi:MAG TPA: hypothetical protein VK162_25235 [Streptosporangiaceae bacterium]|nr:hypothetical protein [Streptosporangiaceae bacterium]